MTTNLPCRTAPDAFFARDNERSDSPQAIGRVALAKALCSACPIRLACRDEGREINATGIWGGETDGERRKAGYKAANRRRLPAPCGTEAGQKRHRRNGEECQSCSAGAAAAWRARKAAAQYRLTTAA